jgi:hypothetical protein
MTDQAIYSMLNWKPSTFLAEILVVSLVAQKKRCFTQTT